MVSFWPWKGDANSAASFEKVLSQLSTKITKVSTQNDGFRQHQRRYKVLWTLYTTFAYILVALILTLVTGYQTWGAVEYSAVAGGPVLIYGVRTALDAYYNYRISGSQGHLNELLKQREAAIDKLKAATKYDSTQQLLDKYGGAPGKGGTSPLPKKRKAEGGHGDKLEGHPPGPRTGFAPPPTANIQRPASVSFPSPPGASSGGPRSRQVSMAGNASLGLPTQTPDEDFAPNAFSAPIRPPTIRQATQQYAADGPKWHDRILDVVLGEDETQAKNRIALICESCRLVNGQAPPSARTLEDVGRWRCSSCHAWNGIESEDSKVLRQFGVEPQSPASPQSPGNKSAQGSAERASVRDIVDENDEEDEGQDVAGDGSREFDDSPASSTRSKARQRSKQA